MAIKFSQFTVRTSSSDLSHIVGYNGADNIQITPTNFLNSALTGTAGQVLFYDTTGVAGDNDLYWDNSNKRLGIGTTSPGRDLQVGDGSSNSAIAIVGSGSGISQLALGNSADDNYAQIILDNSNNKLQIQNGGGGTLTNRGITLDSSENVGIGTTSPSEKLEVVGNIKVGDSEQFIAGAGNDLKIYHNGVNSVIESDTGNLALINTADNRDILFQSDNGSGGTATYFFLDGQNTRTEFLKDVKFPDNVKANFGTSVDLQIWHDGSNSYISNEGVGNINIQNTADDKDIIFKSDNGAGGVTEYFRVDGGDENVRFSKDAKFSDSVKAVFGGSNDLQIYHNGTNSLIENNTGDFYISNKHDDGDIIFFCDDGSGGTTEYFRLDGSAGGALPFTVFPDNSNLTFGTGYDLRQYHNGSNSYLDNYEGDLIIRNYADDKDIQFSCDDGSGGTTTYFQLDGSHSKMIAYKDIHFEDNIKARFGNYAAADLEIYHDGTDSVIQNDTGDLEIQNRQDDGDIVFKSDDGAGGVTTYFYLDGSGAITRVSKNFRTDDSVRFQAGSNGDLQIYHDGTHSYLSNNTGNLYIQQLTDDSDIVFQSDDGAGGVTTYMFLDGSTTLVQFYKSTKHSDNIKANFGSSNDLQIYHDGSNSFITENNTGGSLIIRGSNFAVQSSDGTDDFITTVANQGVKLFYNDVEKLETTSTGIKISGVSEYADNTAAIAGGLTTGDVYRTGDLLKIVH